MFVFTFFATSLRDPFFVTEVKSFPGSQAVITAVIVMIVMVALMLFRRADLFDPNFNLLFLVTARFFRAAVVTVAFLKNQFNFIDF